MYIAKIRDKNIGPLEEVSVDFPFSELGNPKPVIFVGENGSGKSTFLSNIVDAFYTLADKHFGNAMERSDDSDGKQYYKAISPVEIHTGQNSMYSYIYFTDSKPIHYFFKAGKISDAWFKKQVDIGPQFTLTWSEKGNYKGIQANPDDVEGIFKKDIICYFGPDRYEKPMWMGKKYSDFEDYYHPSVKTSWNGILQNPIAIKNVTEVNLQWLLDVIVDSRLELIGCGNYLQPANANTFLPLMQSRLNLETIMSKIIGKRVQFSLNIRNAGASRFKIVEAGTNVVVAPTLDSLSTGQIALFNMFSSIVRYADANDLNSSIRLDQISGMVVIDEIELHLHTKLQKEVLPELIKLFPKVQFIITTHAPLFLLGMQDIFGDDGYEIYEMPTATKINVERFSEFQRAYDYFKKTETYQKDAQNAIATVSSNKKAIVVTEGATDWKHMKTAMAVLKEKEEYVELFSGLDFDFFEYEPANSKDEAEHKLEMGDKALISICENYAKLPQNVRYIFIADRDVETTSKKMGCATSQYKKWAPNVYSFLLPIPESRKETPNICIEHMYSDEQIKTDVVVNGVARRLYLGNEFDPRGLAPAIDRYCEKSSICGPDKISIIEGSQGDKITSISGNDGVTNYALSKMNFAKHVVSNPEHFDFENFVEIFKVIKAIIEEENGNA